MVTACVLICYEAGMGPAVLKAVRKVRGVEKATPVLGRWDLVAEVEVADVKALGDAALKLSGTAGIRAVETLVGF